MSQKKKFFLYELIKIRFKIIKEIFFWSWVVSPEVQLTLASRNGVLVSSRFPIKGGLQRLESLSRVLQSESQLAIHCEE